MTQADFESNETVVQAVLYNLIVIGETATNIPTDIQQRLPKLPWRLMSDMRNLIAHEYFQVDREIVWDTVQNNLTQLKLIDWCSVGGREEFDKYLSIDTYLREQIKPLPSEKVFKEEFSFQQIYIPLKAISLDANGEKIRGAHDFMLDQWVQKTVLDPEKQDKVIFIQAGPGRGKTVFCRMFADWTRRKLHPLLTPILIRLRDIENFEQSFGKTISEALSHCDFVSNDDGWLTDRNTQYLFLLDGFDELQIEGRASGGIERFIEQVGRFQEKFKGKETGHRIILTGRSLALQGINYLPDNLERIELLPMNDNLQDKWLKKWQKVVILGDSDAAKEETEKFQEFLKAEDCPKEIKDELAREPLLLYLLAKLHKNEEIGKEDFYQANDSTQSKILIYQKSLEWVLKEQRNELDQYKITGLNIDSLERILTEAGLCVVQSGGKYAKVKMIETRLAKDDSDAADIIKKLRQRRGEKALTTALGAFYLRPAAGEMGGGVEFYHKSFGEFLCAKRLLASLEEWTEKGNKRRKWVIDNEQLPQKIYDILGYGGLSPEIVEYLRGLLEKSKEFQPIKLFQRLEDFYLSWCEGEFIDAEGTTFPQKKMRELKEQLPARETHLGQKQVDVYTGLNTIILLLELHRYSQKRNDLKREINFHPCGKYNDQGELEDDTRLLRIMKISSCLGNDGFLKTVGSFLTEANLSKVNLSHSNLSKVNFSKTDLSGAKLRQVYLTEANLSHANLTDTDLCRSDLTGSDLQDAILQKAYLRGADCREAKFNRANLEGADLCRAYLYNTNFSHTIFSRVSVKKANLDAANFHGADFDNLIWDTGTQWFNARGLHKTKKTPQKLISNNDFQEGKELSVGIEMLESGNISKALEICRKVAEKVEIRRGSTFKAHIYNRFAWLSCLLNTRNECRGEIAQLAKEACTLDPKNGNYKDTHAVALILNPIIDIRPPFSESEDDYRDREIGNPYEESIKLFREVLNSEDFQTLALPNMQKIRERRKYWIEQLENKKNPLTVDMISLLLKEEY